MLKATAIETNVECPMAGRENAFNPIQKVIKCAYKKLKFSFNLHTESEMSGSMCAASFCVRSRFIAILGLWEFSSTLNEFHFSVPYSRGYQCDVILLYD